jgi:hypothetical protein
VDVDVGQHNWGNRGRCHGEWDCLGSGHERRFKARIDDPLRQWKLSPMDLESYRRARDMMLDKTDSNYAPWYIVHSDDKRRARLNCISHILDKIPFEKVSRPKVKLPKRSDKHKYDDRLPLNGMKFVAEKY